MYKLYKQISKLCNFTAAHPIISLVIGTMLALPTGVLWGFLNALLNGEITIVR